VAEWSVDEWAGVGAVSEPGVLRSVLGRRRRANAPGGRRVVAHQVKVTAEEEAVLVRLAEQAGVSVPRLLVESAVAQDKVTATDRRAILVALFELNRVVGGAANNLNQLARHANATGDFPQGAFPVREQLRGLYPRIEATLDLVAGTRPAEPMVDPRTYRRGPAQP